MTRSSIRCCNTITSHAPSRCSRAPPQCRRFPADGKTYTFRIKPGIFHAGRGVQRQKRELTAHYVYSIKRLIDPVVKAQWQFLVDGKLQVWRCSC